MFALHVNLKSGCLNFTTSESDLNCCEIFVRFFQTLLTKLFLLTPANGCSNVLGILRCFLSSNLFKRDSMLVLFEERLIFLFQMSRAMHLRVEITRGKL